MNAHVPTVVASEPPAGSTPTPADPEKERSFTRRHPILTFVLKRLTLAIPLLFIVSILTFVIVSLIPGDPAVRILGGTATPEAYAELNERLGLTQPLPARYWTWLSGVLRGDLGESIFTHQPVVQQINQRMGVTLALVFGSLLVSSVIGVALGTYAARSRGLARLVTDVLSWVGFAVPSFWLGYLLVLVFAVELGILPASGYVPITTNPWLWLVSFVLPVFTLAIHASASIAKQTRDAMDTVLSSEFITTLRAQGVPERSVVFRHALRNAALPILTVLGLVFVGTLSGTVLVERVFVLPGLGSLVIDAASSHDLPVVTGVVLFFATLVILVNLIVDVLYGWLDPRVRVR